MWSNTCHAVPNVTWFCRWVQASDLGAGTVFYLGFASVKYLSQRPNPRAKTSHKIWMTGLNPTSIRWWCINTYSYIYTSLIILNAGNFHRQVVTTWRKKTMSLVKNKALFETEKWKNAVSMYYNIFRHIYIQNKNGKCFRYEVRDLFPWEMFTKMVISCLLNVEKIWHSAQINLSSTLNFYRKYVFDATISTEKSTSEIDADLAQSDM